MKNKSGITLIELLFVMVIFSIVMAGLYSSNQVMLRQGVREFRQAETSMEVNIAGSIIERDLSMAGYGLAEDYSLVAAYSAAPPKAVSATDGAPDTLTLRGTALGMGSRAAQGWTFMTAVNPGVTFQQWNDAREDVRTDASGNDVVILVEPTSKSLLPQGNVWLFQFQGSTANVAIFPGSTSYANPSVGITAYGLHKTSDPSTATQPWYAIRYYLGGASPATCAPGTQSLLRAESTTSDTPGGGQQLINCVLDFQVAFGLDGDDNGSIDTWDNGGVTAATYAGVSGPTVLNRQLKQIRAYVLVQVGNRDPDYTYSNPENIANPDHIRVGELTLTGGATGRDVTLTAAQRKYRWRVLRFAVTPRNIR